MTQKELATLTARLDVLSAQAREVANGAASSAGPNAVIVGKSWLTDLCESLRETATALRSELMSDAPVEMPKEDAE